MSYNQDRSKYVLLLPACLVLLYLGGTYLLFLVGPFDWEIRDPVLLTGLMLFYCLAFAFGYGVVISSRGVREVPPGQAVLNLRLGSLGTIVFLTLLLPGIYIYTGRSIAEIGEAANDPRAAYVQFQETVSQERSGARLVFIFVRLATAPLTWAAVPLLTVAWSYMRRIPFLLLLHFAGMVLWSLFRGTDKETFDLLILAMGGLMVAIFRGQDGSDGNRPNYWTRSRLVVLALFGVAAATFAFVMHADRKQSRLGYSNAIVISERGYHATGLQIDTDKYTFGAIMLMASCTHGYQAFALALEEPWEPTFPFGHSDVMLAAATAFFPEIYQRTYNAKLTARGWRDREIWSTTFVQLANDVGFLGVGLVMVVFGAGMAASWRDACHGDVPATVVFVILFYIAIWMPANNQLFLTPDGYTITGFWTLAWRSRWFRSQIPLLKSSPERIPRASLSAARAPV